MPKIQYRINIKATLEGMTAGEVIIIPISNEVTLEGVRTTASRLKPMIFSVNKCAEGAQVTRKS